MATALHRRRQERSGTTTARVVQQGPNSLDFLPISGYQIRHVWHHSASCPEKSELYPITGVLISSDRTRQTAQTIDLLIAQKKVIRILDHKCDRFCQRIHAFVI